MHENLMQLQDLNIIHYKIIDAHQIGIRYHREYAEFISANRQLLQIKTMESVVAAALGGHPLAQEEMIVAGHTTNIIMFIVARHGKDRLPNAKTIAQLAVTVATVEDIIMEQILIDDEELEKRK